MPLSSTTTHTSPALTDMRKRCARGATEDRAGGFLFQTSAKRSMKMKSLPAAGLLFSSKRTATTLSPCRVSSGGPVGIAAGGKTRHLAAQPRARHLPFALHGALRDADHGRGLFHRQASEEAQLHDLP